MKQLNEERQNERLVGIRNIYTRNLADWFKKHQRDLPWRKRRTPYRVWVAELMLQQTRVDQVIPYYQRFMKRFPSIRSLAQGSRDEVLKLWEGLGYYARARRMHETAKLLSMERNGRFPESYAELLALPGIGPYSASAISSFALGLDLAVVDGNVKRVLSRLFALNEPTDSPRSHECIRGLAQALVIPGQSALCNEAIMELGALCCLPRRPACGCCPLQDICKAYQEGDPLRYPVRKPKKKIPHKIVGAGIVYHRGKFLIAQRRERAMLGGLWEFPGGAIESDESMEGCIARELKEELAIEVTVGTCLTIVRHAYSHFTITLHAHWCNLNKTSPKPQAVECADFAWVNIKNMKKFAFSRADLYIINALQKWVDGERHGLAT